MRVGIIAYRRTAGDAGVFQTEWFTGVQINNLAARSLFATATGGNLGIGEGADRRVKGVVKRVTSPRVDGDLPLTS
jgi:hypothetical protein